MSCDADGVGWVFCCQEFDVGDYVVVDCHPWSMYAMHDFHTGRERDTVETRDGHLPRVDIVDEIRKLVGSAEDHFDSFPLVADAYESL